MVPRMFRRLPSGGLLLAAALLALASLSSGPSPAEGQGRNTAQIYVVQGRVPSSFPGKDGALKFGRKNHRNTLQEVTGVPVKDRSWLARLVIQFQRPLGDWEYDILYFEKKGAQRELIGSVVTVHVSDRNERTFIQRIELKRPEFKPKSKIELALRVRGRKTGTRNITLAGEELRVRYSGSVDFTQ